MSRFVFPGVPVGFRCNDAGVEPIPSVGLTKRELFAAMAMQGLLSNPKCWDEEMSNAATGPLKAAMDSIQFADALIAELNEGVA